MRAIARCRQSLHPRVRPPRVFTIQTSSSISSRSHSSTHPPIVPHRALPDVRARPHLVFDDLIRRLDLRHLVLPRDDASRASVVHTLDTQRRAQRTNARARVHTARTRRTKTQEKRKNIGVRAPEYAVDETIRSIQSHTLMSSHTHGPVHKKKAVEGLESTPAPARRRRPGRLNKQKFVFPILRTSSGTQSSYCV